MNNILFYIGIFITIVLAFSYCLVIWKKEKIKLFKEQIKEAFDNANKIAEVIKAPSQKIIDECKINIDKMTMQKSLEVKLETETKIKELKEETLNKLMDTGLTRDEAMRYIK